MLGLVNNDNNNIASESEQRSLLFILPLGATSGECGDA